MARKKTLVVPKEGTQPATVPTPLDNLVSGGNTPSMQTDTSESDIQTSVGKLDKKSKASMKRTCTFSIDNQIFSQFKSKCAANMDSMSSVIESYMKIYINN